MSRLEALGVTKRFRLREVVKDLSLSIESGQVVGLLGPNGAGKTTAFYMIVGLIRCDRGTIQLNGRDVTRLPVHRRARLGLGYLPQEASVFRKLSVADKAQLDLSFLKHPTIHSLELTRATFIEKIDPLLTKSLSAVNEALEAAKEKGVQREQIDAILLVGGSSKIPRVKERLLEFFQKDEKFVQADVNPDTVVARGAAIMAYRFQASPAPFDIRQRKQQATLMNTEAADVQDVRMITEHSLGVGVQNNQVQRIVPRASSTYSRGIIAISASVSSPKRGQVAE
jgi:ABC-type Fe3+/spermidine/putrescine transport system ATPase subunit